MTRNTFLYKAQYSSMLDMNHVLLPICITGGMLSPENIALLLGLEERRKSCNCQ